MYSVYENINLFLKDNKSSNIVFCVANNGILNMTKNLLISAKNNNIDLVLFALDNQIVENLKNECTIIKYFDNEVNYNKFYEYGTIDFKKVVFQRFFIGNEILKANKSYIYLDIDIVITKNFIENILEQYTNTNYDCLCQYNGTNCCTGFYSMRPTNKTISINYDFYKKNDYLNFNHDQDFFNKVILNNKILNIKFLDMNKYPNGNMYYLNNNKIEKECYIIHFNCVIGYKTKIDKMKLYKKWYL